MVETALALLTLLMPTSWANDRFRPERPEELPFGTRTEETLSVPGAQAIYVNFRALRRDFPGLRNLDDSQIVKFIESKFNRIGSRQPRLNGVRQTRIPIDPEAPPLRGYRPPGTFRSLHFFVPSPDPASAAAGETINVDLKGSGLGPESDQDILEMLQEHREALATQDAERQRTLLDALFEKGHSSGLSDHTSIAELTRLEALQKLADLRNFETQSDHQVSEVYFLLRYPFDILRKDGKLSPAIAIGRQTNFGRSLFEQSGHRIPDDLYEDERGLKQRTFSNAAIDAGGMLITGDPLTENFGLGPNGDKRRTATYKPEIEAKVIANSLSGSQKEVDAHLAQMLEPLMSKWRGLPDSVKNSEPQSKDGKRRLEIYRLAQKRRPEPADVDAILSYLEAAKDPYFSLLIISKLEGKVSLTDYPRFEPLLEAAVFKTQGLEASRSAANWLLRFKPRNPDLIGEVFSKVQKTGGAIAKHYMDRQTMELLLRKYVSLAAALPREHVQTLIRRLIEMARDNRVLMRKRLWAYRLASEAAIDDDRVLSSLRKDLLDPPSGKWSVKSKERIDAFELLTHLAARSASASRLLAEIRSASFADSMFARRVRGELSSRSPRKSHRVETK